jgi:outer membrane receptor protein involved in Fe transport
MIACCALSILAFPPRLRAEEETGKPGTENVEEVFKDTKVMFVGEDLYTVTVASRREEPLRRAPAAVTIIGGEELRRYRTLAEALSSVPGFFADRNETKNRMYLRGVPDSFLVLMDGVPFSNDTSTRDYPRETELSLDYLEKIEIIRGPGSALWGADAFSGIVNLVPKKGKDLQGTTVSSEVGTFDTQRYSLLSGYNVRDVDVLLSANYTATEDFEHNLPGLNDRPRDYAAEFYGKVRFKEHLEISGRLSHYKNFTQYEINPAQALLPVASAYSREAGYALPSWEDRVREQWQGFLSTPRSSFRGEEYSPFSFLQATYTTEIGSSSSLLLAAYLERFENKDESYWYTAKTENWQYGFEGKFDFNFLPENFMTIGYSMKYNDADSTRWQLKILDGRSTTIIPSFETYLYSFYFQDKYRITDDLELTAGVRYDEPDDYENSVSPRIGLSWSFLDNFNLKLLYGRAFRTPARYLVVNESNLDTEKIESWEAELGYRYGEKLSLKGNFFYNKLKDIVEEVAFGIVRRRGRDNVKGIEFSANYRPVVPLSLYGNISYLFKNRDDFVSSISLPSPDLSQVEEISLKSALSAPRGTFNWGATYDFRERVAANLNFSYYMKRETGENPFYSRTGSLSPYLLVDFNLSLKHLWHDRLGMSVKLRNSFNESYTSRGRYSAVDGAGRGAYFSLQYTFK